MRAMAVVMVQVISVSVGSLLLLFTILMFGRGGKGLVKRL